MKSDPRTQYLPWTRGDDAFDDARREDLITNCGATFGDRCYVAPDARVFTNSLVMGDQSYIAANALVRGDVAMGSDCTVNAFACLSGKIKMGDGVRIASLVTIVGFNHGFDDLDTPIHHQPCTYEGITIGDGVWIGANAVILDGVTLGDHCIVAAGAIVTKDAPPYSILAGNPARVIRDRREPARKPSTSKVAAAIDDFARRVADEWPAVLEANTAEVDGVVSYLDKHRQHPTARAWCDAIEIAAMFDQTPALRPAEELIEMLQSWQNPATGLFPDPWNPPAEHDRPERLTDHLSRYHLLAVGYALECLNARPLHMIHVVENITPNDLLAHLDQLPWKTQAWGGGDWVDCFGTGLYLNCKYFDAAHRPEILLGWLTAHVDARTGLWGDPTPEQGLLQPVNGFYRASRGTFAQFGVALPAPEAAIDSVLRHSRASGNFRESNITACNLLDVVHPLWLCARQTDYRRGEILDLVRTLMLDAMARWIPGKGFKFSPTVEAGLQGTEMWLSIIYLAADLLGVNDRLGYRPKGVHRLEPALPLGEMGTD